MPGSNLTRRPDGTKLTYDGFVHFPGDGMRHELTDGEHIVSPLHTPSTRRLSGNLHGLLWACLREHRIGPVFAAPFDVVLSHFDVVEPDLLYISNERRSVLTPEHVRGAPDLAREVGSPGTRRRDERQTFALFERTGVAEGRYVRTAELSLDRGDLLTSPLFPGLEITLSIVFDLPDIDG